MERLKKRSQFKAAAASGMKWVRPAFVIQFHPHGDAELPACVGFTVTKKQGNAVQRNRMRRRLKEAARLALPEVVQAGCDYVIIGRYAAKDIAFDKLTLELAESVVKLHALLRKKQEK